MKPEKLIDDVREEVEDDLDLGIEEEGLLDEFTHRLKRRVRKHRGELQ